MVLVMNLDLRIDEGPAMTQYIIKANCEMKDSFMALSLTTKECVNAVLYREQEKFDEAILERWCQR